MYIASTCKYHSKRYHCCRLPFLKEKVSDEVTYAPCVIETLSLLGRMINSTNLSVQRAIVTSVRTLYEGEATDQANVPDSE